MYQKKKELAVILSFFLVLCGLSLSGMILPDQEVSKSERRKLATFPKLTYESLQNGNFGKQFETYSLDQFIWRDVFRNLKARELVTVLRQKDNNGYYAVNGSVYSMEYPVNEKKVIRAAELFMKVKEELFENANVYFSIIPDKSHYVAEDAGYPSGSYKQMNVLMQEQMKDVKQIEIENLLDTKNYYYTDLHWKQETIVPVAEKLIQGMGVDDKWLQSLQENLIFENFYGGWQKQYALPVKADELVCMSSPWMEQLKVYDYETQSESSVYHPEKFFGLDGYDVYLAGARALLTIENPENRNGKQLILFRDSFGSSIAPILAGCYEKITLVDLRYLSPELLSEYITVKEGDDVLFLYNTFLLNNSDSLKFYA